ncbi:MAG: hypothetical protein QG597_2352 [Actinomycetota bacterium]|nr:hypothetical protein [Actinomycetota bacterium]
MPGLMEPLQVRRGTSAQAKGEKGWATGYGVRIG